MLRVWVLILALVLSPAMALRAVHAAGNNGNGNGNGAANGNGNAGGNGAGNGASNAGGNGNGNGNGNNSGNGNAYGRGKKSGDYTYVVAGEYKGTGTGSVTDAVVSISLTIQVTSGGQKFDLAFNNMPLTNDRFIGTATSNGVTFTLSGRVDLPAATDPDQTAEQAITGRVTATLTDSNGKGARAVGIQDASSRGRPN